MKSSRGKRSKLPASLGSLTARRGDPSPRRRPEATSSPRHGGRRGSREGPPRRGLPGVRVDPAADRGRFRRPGGSASVGTRKRREKAGRGVPRLRPRAYSLSEGPASPPRPRRKTSEKRARSPRGAGGSVPTPRARRTLTKRLRPTRLETRTKESNARASVVVANQNTGGPRKGPRWNAQRKRKRGNGLALAGIPPPLSAGEAPSTDPELPPSGATPGDRNERFE